jgi:hypothetical protein
MTKLRTISGFIAAALLASAAVAFNATPSAAGSLRLECEADGPGQTGFHARYEERVRSATFTRKKFDAEFEAKIGRGFTAGQRISFVVGSVTVGSAPLKVIDAELVAELSLDNRPDNGDKPFPTNWPGIHAGSVVKAKHGTTVLLGCTVQ